MARMPPAAAVIVLLVLVVLGTVGCASAQDFMGLDLRGRLNGEALQGGDVAYEVFIVPDASTSFGAVISSACGIETLSFYTSLNIFLIRGSVSLTEGVSPCTVADVRSLVEATMDGAASGSATEFYFIASSTSPIALPIVLIDKDEMSADVLASSEVQTLISNFVARDCGSSAVTTIPLVGQQTGGSIPAIISRCSTVTAEDCNGLARSVLVPDSSLSPSCFATCAVDCTADAEIPVYDLVPSVTITLG